MINKMVSKDDLLRTVTTAYANGWRQVKLYFMCGLPTETDEDVLGDRRHGARVIRAGRAAAGTQATSAARSRSGRSCRSRTRRSSGRRSATRARRRAAAALRRRDQLRPVARPGHRVPLPRRAAVDRRGAAVPRRPAGGGGDPRGLGGRRAVRRLERALLVRALDGGRRPAVGVDVDWYTSRERGENEVLPWDHLDSGLDKEWLWTDWQDALSEDEQDETAGGRPATTAGSARGWAPRSRSAPPARRSSRSPS